MTADSTVAETEEREPVVTAPFGPGFFLGQLRAFARDRCPDPSEGLPSVELHLATGEVLDLCHVMGLAPCIVALAIREGSGTEARMRTEIVPYSLITRVTIRPARAAGSHVGFDLHHTPEVLAHGDSAEETLKAAAAPGPEHAHPTRPPPR